MAKYNIVPALLSTRALYLENAQHCGASLIEYTCRTWSSYMPFDCHQNAPQATEYHIKYTHVYTGTVSQAWL